MKMHLRKISDTHFEMKNNQGEIQFNYEYQQEYQLSIQRWYGFLPEENVIDIYKQIGSFAKEESQSIQIAVGDLQEYEGSFHLASDWFVNYYMPKAIQAGFCCSIFIKSKNFITNLALEDAFEMLHKIAGKDYQVPVVDSIEKTFTKAKDIYS